ncbi:hypothetical protein RIB2604_02503350 [Aspergillus luchuensis]|uniref:Uncharacterized protein n=1 Tax=Aspergillus kawachii TaxID=1069201 RepID=A0A146FRZ0_ASPKA|nr:hypothetical protein RIB2604_02503350 [Aspergillus luchuensis]
MSSTMPMAAVSREPRSEDIVPTYFPIFLPPQNARAAPGATASTTPSP